MKTLASDVALALGANLSFESQFENGLGDLPKPHNTWVADGVCSLLVGPISDPVNKTLALFVFKGNTGPRCTAMYFQSGELLRIETEEDGTILPDALDPDVKSQVLQLFTLYNF